MKNESSKNQTKEASAPEPVPMPVPKPEPAPVTNTVPQNNGIAVASMVIGIVALLIAWIPFIGFIGFVGGITAIVLGIIALKKAVGKGMSIAGIITGALSILSSLAMTFIFFGLIVLGTAAVENGAVVTENYNKEQQTLLDAKKDFSKGQTAVFGNFEVKANSVQRNYVPENAYSAASEGKELVVVNVTVQNIGTTSKSFTTYDLSLNVNGVSDSSSYVVVSPEFTGGNISAGATASGNIVYEITKDATNLKLQHEEIIYDLNNSEVKTLTYTLAI